MKFKLEYEEWNITNHTNQIFRIYIKFKWNTNNQVMKDDDDNDCSFDDDDDDDDDDVHVWYLSIYVNIYLSIHNYSILIEMHTRKWSINSSAYQT